MKFLLKIGFALQILFLIHGANRHLPEAISGHSIVVNRLQQATVLMATDFSLLTGLLPENITLLNQAPPFKVPESQNHYKQLCVNKGLLKSSAVPYLIPAFSEACTKLISKLQIRAIIFPFNYFW
jgi:hypothetical protein